MICGPDPNVRTRGRFEEALKWYRRWLEVEPGNPAAMHAAAGILIWNQRFDEGAALFEEIATVAPGVH